MGKISLSNVPENWVYNTMGYKPWEIKRILAALPIEVEKLGELNILVKPKKGHEKAMRIICGRLFTRMKGEYAREFLKGHKAATK